MEKIKWPQFKCVFHVGATFLCAACQHQQIVTDEKTELCLECWRSVVLSKFLPTVQP